MFCGTMWDTKQVLHGTSKWSSCAAETLDKLLEKSAPRSMLFAASAQLGTHFFRPLKNSMEDFQTWPAAPYSVRFCVSLALGRNELIITDCGNPKSRGSPLKHTLLTLDCLGIAGYDFVDALKLSQLNHQHPSSFPPINAAAAGAVAMMKVQAMN